MVEGLDKYADHFEFYKFNYVLIGGTACDLAMQIVGQSFRATFSKCLRFNCGFVNQSPEGSCKNDHGQFGDRRHRFLAWIIAKKTSRSCRCERKV